ncbi:MAG TPA: PIN domain-containing protein [Acidobacteriaceae bacterium]|jgi:predicted nucleic acid-binding protein|nr:PIN domain-containing protein [Acidobacteriaceae bacterium]
MKLYVLDANAVVRYMTRGKDWDRVDALFEKARAGRLRLLISVVNWGEAIYTLAKPIGLPKVMADLRILGAALETVSVEEDMAEEAATLKYNFKLGYGDSFAAALALRMNATLVSADPDFVKLGKRLKWMPLQPYKG